MIFNNKSLALWRVKVKQGSCNRFIKTNHGPAKIIFMFALQCLSWICHKLAVALLWLVSRLFHFLPSHLRKVFPSVWLSSVITFKSISGSKLSKIDLCKNLICLFNHVIAAFTGLKRTGLSVGVVLALLLIPRVYLHNTGDMVPPHLIPTMPSCWIYFHHRFREGIESRLRKTLFENTAYGELHDLGAL